MPRNDPTHPPCPSRPGPIGAWTAIGAARIAAIAILLVGSFGWGQIGLGIPVSLPDPLGLGEGVPVRLAPAADAATEPAQEDPEWDVEGSFPMGSDVIRVPSMGPDDFPFGVPPSRLEVQARLGSALVLGLPGPHRVDDYPEEIVTSAASIVSIRVADDSGAPAVTLGPFAADGSGGLSWHRTDRCDPGHCRYRSASDGRLGAMVIAADGKPFAAVLDVLGNDVSPNRLTGRLALALDVDLPDGATIDVTLLAPSGTAYF